MQHAIDHGKFAMMRLQLDKIASATKNVPLHKEIRIQKEIIAQEGYLVAGRIIGDKSNYNTLENGEGRMVPIHDGDIITGVLGHRNALLGYSGIVPDEIKAGDRLNVLNLGGVIGQCTSWNPDNGPPFDIEMLGAVLVFPEVASRVGVPAHVAMNALSCDRSLQETHPVPIVFIAGTCMNAGKTFAACQMIRYLSSQGLTVAGCKLTGVSLLRDVLNMRDYGAKHSASFVEAGVVTTNPDNALACAHTIVGSLSQTYVDVIIAELGDGIMGMYGVDRILQDSILMGRRSAFVLCANDPVGSWGSVKLLKEKYSIQVDIITGPTTDNEVGTRFITETLGVKAINARRRPRELGAFVLDYCKQERAKQ